MSGLPLRIEVPTEEIAEFCRRHHIGRLLALGSVLREDFSPESDTDLIVEFEPDARVGLIRLAGIELELSELVGRTVDLLWDTIVRELPELLTRLERAISDFGGKQARR
ncbi:MAG: nucleotidyltransferase family protein [Armatimonadota bacterium]